MLLLRRFQRVACLCFSSILFFSYCASLGYASSLMSWNELTYHTLLDNQQWEVLFQTHARFIPGNRQPLQQMIQRNIIGYVLNPELTLDAGYDFNPSMNPLGNDAIFEHRLLQQVQWAAIDKDNYALALRSRLEERTRVDARGVQLRFRQRFALTLAHLFVLVPERSTPIVYDEVFFNATHTPWSSPGLIDQNRLFVGYWFYLGKHATLELGYLHQYLPRGNASVQQHIASCALRLVDF